MFVWNEPELIDLRKRTAHEKGWRRWSALIFAFFSVCGGGAVGALFGVAIAEYVVSGRVPHIEQLMSLEFGVAHIIVAVVVMIVALPVSVIIWSQLMEKTSLISKDMVRRILRYGPY